jgi:HD-like signal output (HDOD) protein
MMQNKIDFAAEIASNNELMALPGTVLKIMETASNEEVNLDELSNLIGRDPALAGRLLKIANSPYYGLSQKVNNIHQAVMVLGVTTVKCLALSAALLTGDRAKRLADLDVAGVYGNIISIAVTCRKLAVAGRYKAPEDAFTCGLLHDVGLIYILHHHPDIYREMISAAKNDQSFHSVEATRLGICHADIGRMIAEKWRLPKEFISAISNHNSCGDARSQKLDDIIRLAVALNRDVSFTSDQCLEDKITKISVIAARLGIGNSQLDDVASSAAAETMAFANAVNIEVGDYQAFLAKANKELFRTYMAIQSLFRERQELTRKILEEERERGLLEAKHVAISTMSHYINNSSMAISGNCQMLRMALGRKTPEEIVAMLPKSLGVIDESVQKIIAVLEEFSELTSLEKVEYLSQSHIIDFDERIRARLAKLKDETGIVLPEEAQIDL